MNIIRILIVVLFCNFVAVGPAFAHETHSLAALRAGELGVTQFVNSGARRAQPAFLHGLLLLHSFEYAAARRDFLEAEKIDRGFVMAYWGEALTYNQPLWREQDRDSANAALARLARDPAARAAKAATPRERAYLASVEQLYGVGDKAVRDAAYCVALGLLAERYPADLDARALYSLSLLGLTNGERNVANYMRAAAEAEAVLRVSSRHPGALHYLIHATDDPVHAPLGLQAARLYGKVAPSASHAQHMPSHIFFALGLWDDAIEANLASLTNGRAHGESSYHSLLWLAYAYLQNNQSAQAEQLVRSVAADVVATPSKDNRARLSYARAMWLVETRGMAGLDANTPVDNQGINSINYFVVHDFARGISAAPRRPADAKAALVQLQGRIDMAQVAPQSVTIDWLDNVTHEELEEAKILALALSGTIRFYAGEAASGIDEVRDACTRAEHLQFDYGPPWSVKPLDELLGELLLADGRLDEAATAFRKTLDIFPNRRLAREDLAGALAQIEVRGPSDAGVQAVLRREDLLGVWRLVRIDYVGPNGPLDDPFYHAGSSGLLTYDESGSMSVQIAGLTRPRLPVPNSRPVDAATMVDAPAKAAALDSYYAYFGTWDYDASHATVTHHIGSALLPAENGVNYSQNVALTGNQLTFVTHQKTAGGDFTRTKVWIRVGAARVGAVR